MYVSDLAIGQLLSPFWGLRIWLELKRFGVGFAFGLIRAWVELERLRGGFAFGLKSFELGFALGLSWRWVELRPARWVSSNQYQPNPRARQGSVATDKKDPPKGG